LLETHETPDTIFGREALHQPRSVLVEARDQVGRDADVERSIGPAGENVDTRLPHRLVHAKKWMLKQVQHDGESR
jgi:hypothetical protein